MSELTKEEIYRQLNEEFASRAIQKGEILVSDFARDNGYDIDYARNFLKSLEKEGKIITRIISYPKRAMVFRLVQDTPPAVQGSTKKKGRQVKTF